MPTDILTQPGQVSTRDQQAVAAQQQQAGCADFMCKILTPQQQALNAAGKSYEITAEQNKQIQDYRAQILSAQAANKPIPSYNAAPTVGETHYSASGVEIMHYGENIPRQYDPSSEQLARAQQEHPGHIDMSSPLVRVGPYVIPQDVFYGLYTPMDTGRYQEAKSYMAGLGHEMGGGTTAVPGTTGTVHVTASGVAIPNYGANERAERGITEQVGPWGNVEIAGNGQVLGKSYSLIAGSPQEGWSGQNLSASRAQMAFQPRDMIVLQKMNGELPSYAIPTSSLATNNPWDPTIINRNATERANQLTEAMVAGRPGYNPEFGKTFMESANSVLFYENAKEAAQAHGDVATTFWAQNKEQQAAENLNEWSRAYHEVGQQMGIPIAANRYEAVGDLAVEFLKGTPTRSAEEFSPISGLMLNVLPHYETKGGGTAGLGIQQDAWQQAVARYGGKETNFQNFSNAAQFIVDKAAAGWQGPYGDLYGGQNYKGTVINAPLGEGVVGPQILIQNEAPVAGRLVGGGMVAGQATTTDILSGLPTPFVSHPPQVTEAAQGAVVSTVTRPSDFSLEATRIFGGDTLGARMLVGIGDFVFKPTIETTREREVNLPSSTVMGIPMQRMREVNGGYEITTTTPYITTGGKSIERTTTSAPGLSGFEYGQQQFAKQVTEPVFEKLGIPNLSYRDTGNSPLNYLESFGIGIVQGVREKPLTTAIYGGAGVIMALGGEAIAGLGAATVVATEGSILAPVAVGTAWFATSAAPVALTALYSADVIQRSAEVHHAGQDVLAGWSADMSPAAAQRGGTIFSTEVLPMVAGGAAVAYRGAIWDTVKGAFDFTRGTPAGQAAGNAPSYRITRVGPEYAPDFSKIPSVSEDMFTYGSAASVGKPRLIATNEAGNVVGATAYTVRANDIFIDTMGSQQRGVGTAMVNEMQRIAGESGFRSISGESRPQAIGFWEKMGAEVTPAARGPQPFEMKVPEQMQRYQITNPQVRSLITRMAGEPGITSEVTPINILDALSYRYTEWRTPETAMSGAMPSERFIRPSMRTPETPGYYEGVGTRVNPELARNYANLAFYQERMGSRPSGPSVGTGKLGYRMMAAQPEEPGRLSMIGMGGEGKVSGYNIGQSIYTQMKDMIPGRSIKASEIMAKYEMVRDKITPDIYGKVTTQPKGGNAALVSRVELERPMATHTQEVSLSPTALNAYRYAGKSRIAEVEYDYTSRRLPPGMKSPAPQEGKVLTELEAGVSQEILSGSKLLSIMEVKSGAKSSMAFSKDIIEKTIYGNAPFTSMREILKPGQMFRQEKENVVTQRMKEESMIGFVPLQSFRNVLASTTALRIGQQQDVLSTFRQVTEQVQQGRVTTDTRITTRPPDITTTRDIWRIPPPDVPKLPNIGIGFGGGGGGVFGDIIRTHKRNYENPVVDIKYLSGMFAGPAASRGTPVKKGHGAPVRLLTGQLRSSAKHPHKGGKK
jgi:hypothetical protein